MSEPAADATEPASDGDEVRLSLPARHEYARIARIAVAALALRLGFSYREVEDLRLAIDESLILLLGGDQPGERVTIRYGTEPGHVEVEAETDVETTISAEALERFATLVDELVDSWSLSDDHRRLHLAKRHRAPTD